MAGLAETCSHVGAILHWVETAVRIRDSTTCTSKDNSWLVPTAPVLKIPSLLLSEIDFRGLHKEPKVDLATSSTTKVSAPTENEVKDFFKQIAKEQQKKPIILSVVDPYSEKFVVFSDKLPRLLQSLFKPTYLEYNYSQLLELANDHTEENITPTMVQSLANLTSDQSKSKHWFQYRAGRVTASRFRQVLHTDTHQPSVSLVKHICYPDVHRFSNPATAWGCEHEKSALQAYKSEVMLQHEGVNVSRCGFIVCEEHPFLGASPDALVQCDCCGLGVVEIKCPFCVNQASFEVAVDKSKNFCLDQLPEGIFKLKHDHSYFYQCQLQMFVTKRNFCDFVVWSPNQLHIERVEADEQLIETAVPKSKTFWRLCILPELLGKWYTRTQTLKTFPQSEEDSGTWCYCNENKGGEMIACDNKFCRLKWFHLECVGMSASGVPQGKWLCPSCHVSKSKNKRQKLLTN